MKQIYFIITAATLTVSTATLHAQSWRDKNEGLQPAFGAKNIYGEGTSILVTDAALGFTNHLFYRPDTSTAFVASTSSVGGYGAVLSQIVKAKGALFAGTTGGLYRSTDNGTSWTRSSATTGYIYSLYAVNDTLYGGVGTGLGEVKMSVDTGQTWISIGYPSFMATTYVKANGVLYVGSNNGLKYTADNGTTWTTPPFSSGLSGPIITGLASLGNSVYAACSTGVYKTIDNGSNWSLVLPKSMFSLIAVDTSLIGGTNTWGIYQSDQSGTNWNTINTGLPFVGSGSYYSVNALAYNSEVLIASVQYDSSIYVTDLSSLGLHPAAPSAINETKNSAIAMNIFPNPASTAITLSAPETNSAPIRISINDITGRTLLSTTSNTTQTTIDVSEIKAGLYFIHTSQGSNTTVQKISIVR